MLQKIISLIDEIKVNKQHGKFSVYKPLLLMIVFKQVLNRKKNEFKFKEIYEELELLMEKYGWPTSTRKRAQYPFYFLASSELWEINIDSSELKFPDSPSKTEMDNAIGKLNKEIYSFLINDAGATQSVMKFINNKFFKGEFTF